MIENKEMPVGRDLDALIVEEIFGWHWVPVGPDCNGKNPCKILHDRKELSREYYGYLPLKGKIHPAYLAKQYAANKQHAYELCEHLGLDLLHSKYVALTAQQIASDCLTYFRTKKMPEWTILYRSKDAV